MQAVLLFLVAVVGLLCVALATYAASLHRRQPGPAFDATGLIAELRRENAELLDRVTVHTSERVGDQLAANGRELDLRRQSIDQLMGQRNSEVRTQVESLTGQLQHMSDVVQRLQRDQAQQHTTFIASLEETSRSQQVLQKTTASLTEALAHPKARGSWGERTADDVLRVAGFVEGVSYLRQAHTAAGTTPDFTFLMPEGRHLNMDVKFPADNYLRHLEADNDVDRERYRKAFLADVRSRIRELANRDYIDPGCTLDHLLLFIPNESIYSFILEQDPQIAEVALGQKVVLCSPFTLFGVLSVMRQATELFRLHRQGDEIHRCLIEFSKQWEQFSGAVDDVDKKLGALSTSFDRLKTTRTNQLQRQIDRIANLEPPPPEGAAAEPLTLVPSDDRLQIRDAG
jgi:DNA recombination protein RmuC